METNTLHVFYKAAQVIATHSNEFELSQVTNTLD